MSWHLTEELYKEIISERDLVVGLFNAQGLLVEHSPNLRAFLFNPSLLHPLTNLHIFDLLPELIGNEQTLEAVRNKQEKYLYIERIFRPDLYGKHGYISLMVKSFHDGWLVILRNTTSSGTIEQSVTQQRNELTLLSDEIEKARAKMDRLLRMFVPTAVVDDLLKKHTTNLGGKTQIVTILFGDLRGYTAWAEKHSPEDAIAGLNQCLTAAHEMLNDNGATINQLMGDGFMSIFNAPLDQPQHASLALQSARQIASLPGLDEKMRFGVGVNTGFAMVGNVGSKRAMDYSAIGTTTNIAYRLQQLAGAGEALFGETTRELAGGQFPHVFHGSHEVKGIREPIPVYKLLVHE